MNACVNSVSSRANWRQSRNNDVAKKGKQTRRKLPPETVAEIIRLRRQSCRVRRIARKLGVNYHTTVGVLKRHNLQQAQPKPYEPNIAIRKRCGRCNRLLFKGKCNLCRQLDERFGVGPEPERT